MSSVESWYEEKQSAWAYRELAQCEPDARIAELFRALAAAADFQADKWRANASATDFPAFKPSTRARLTIALARTLGPRRVRHMLAAMKIRGLSVYDSQRSLAGHLMPTRFRTSVRVIKATAVATCVRLCSGSMMASYRTRA
jgi:hypothetical protein